jgi:hypothetical protein
MASYGSTAETKALQATADANAAEGLVMQAEAVGKMMRNQLTTLATEGDHTKMVQHILWATSNKEKLLGYAGTQIVTTIKEFMKAGKHWADTTMKQNVLDGIQAAAGSDPAIQKEFASMLQNAKPFDTGVGGKRTREDDSGAAPHPPKAAKIPSGAPLGELESIREEIARVEQRVHDLLAMDPNTKGVPLMKKIDKMDVLLDWVDQHIGATDGSTPKSVYHLLGSLQKQITKMKDGQIPQLQELKALIGDKDAPTPDSLFGKVGKLERDMLQPVPTVQDVNFLCITVGDPTNPKPDSLIAKVTGLETALQRILATAPSATSDPRVDHISHQLDVNKKDSLPRQITTLVTDTGLLKNSIAKLEAELGKITAPVDAKVNGILESLNPGKAGSTAHTVTVHEMRINSQRKDIIKLQAENVLLKKLVAKLCDKAGLETDPELQELLGTVSAVPTPAPHPAPAATADASAATAHPSPTANSDDEELASAQAVAKQILSGDA